MLTARKRVYSGLPLFRLRSYTGCLSSLESSTAVMSRAKATPTVATMIVASASFLYDPAQGAYHEKP